MEHLQHFFQYGPITAIIAFVMACIGAGLGLRCVVRAFATSGIGKQSWLATGAVAIGAGIWTMHLVAILGFAVEGTPVRYDVSLTLLSLLVAVVVVAAGVFAVGYSASTIRGAVLGGIGSGAGIVAMHYVGMAAMEIHGTLSYELVPVVMSVVIAIGASTIALAVAFLARSFRGTVAAAVLLGAAASATEYAGIAALQIEIMPGTNVLGGASAVEFVFPFIVVFGSFLFLSSAFVALSPIRQERMDGEATAASSEGPDPNLVS